MLSSFLDLSNVARFESEGFGPEIMGTIEFEFGSKQIYQGALVPTTHRLFLNLEDEEGGIFTEEINLKDITYIKSFKEFLLGNEIQIWTGDKIAVRMHGITDFRLHKFLVFLRKHRAKQLNIEDTRVIS